MKRVIITGATGAIGIALINECIVNAIEVLVISREGSKREGNIPCHPLVSIKHCALDGLRLLQNDTGKTYDTLYHFAWEGTSGQGRNDGYLQNKNVRYAMDAVELAYRFGCTAFVGAGSQAEYGRVQGTLTAKTPAFPETGYGIAKLCAGQLTRLRATQLNIRHVWTRILSVYGPNDGAQTLISSLMASFARGETPQCTLGEQQWDYLYSGDIAKAFLALGRRGVDGKIYVLGSGNVRSLKDYICDVRDIVAPQAEIAFGAIPYYENQVMYLCADISEITADTGWRPQVSFREGIRRILDIKEKV